MKKDIQTKEDIIQLVNVFYDKVRKNDILGYIFDEVAKTNWIEHLPVMYSFWGSILLGEKSFSGNPMKKHIELAEITDMTDKEFSEWLRIFYATIDELFEGQTAEEAKARAQNIARLMLVNIDRRRQNI